MAHRQQPQPHQQRLVLTSTVAQLLLALLLLAPRTAAFSFSYFGGKGASSASAASSAASAQYARYLARPLPGTDAFAKVRDWELRRHVGGLSSRSPATSQSTNPTHPPHHTASQRTAGLVVPPSALQASNQPQPGGDKKQVYNPMYFLARFALALAPSTLMGAGLLPLLAEPRAVVAAQADDEFKVGGDLWGVFGCVGGWMGHGVCTYGFMDVYLTQKHAARPHRSPRARPRRSTAGR